MRVTQTAKTINSITVTVEGMNSGDRQTYISLYPPYAAGSYYTLSEAQQLGLITFEVANLVNNNGDIKIIFPDHYLTEHQVCKISVMNVFNGVPYNEVIIPCSVGFDFEKASLKVAGKEIDITVGDVKKINLFCNGLYSAYTNENPAYEYTFENITSGDYIYKEYLETPISNMLNCLMEYELTDSGFNAIRKLISVQNGLSESDSFKAEYFNNIKQAINEHYLTMSN